MADPLVAVLEEARRQGFLGPGPVGENVEHSRSLAAAAGPPPRRFLDLGSGGGVPGLVLAREWPETSGILLDSRQRCCGFLRDACERLGLDDRLQVACGRAEELARTDLRESFDLVVARSFGPAAVTAECGVGFLAIGGRLLVSEAPDSTGERWPAAGLAKLGLDGPEIWRGDGATVAILTRAGTLDGRWPRRPGIPAKRPLWIT